MKHKEMIAYLAMDATAIEFIDTFAEKEEFYSDSFVASTYGDYGAFYRIKEKGKEYYTFSTGVAYTKRINIRGGKNKTTYYRHYILTDEGVVTIQAMILQAII